MPRKVVASTYVTLDGYIDEPGHWSFPFWSQEAADFKARELAASDALLLGRITYEGFAAYWPTMEGMGDFGAKMNAMPKHVASRTLQTATWNATIIEGDVAEAVRSLKAEDGGDLLIGGSGQLIDYLTSQGAVWSYSARSVDRWLPRAPVRQPDARRCPPLGAGLHLAAPGRVGWSPASCYAACGAMPSSCARSGLENGSSTVIRPSARR